MEILCTNKTKNTKLYPFWVCMYNAHPLVVHPNQSKSNYVVFKGVFFLFLYKIEILNFHASCLSSRFKMVFNLSLKWWMTFLCTICHLGIQKYFEFFTTFFLPDPLVSTAIHNINLDRSLILKFGKWKISLIISMDQTVISLRYSWHSICVKKISIVYYCTTFWPCCFWLG